MLGMSLFATMSPSGQLTHAFRSSHSVSASSAVSRLQLIGRTGCSRSVLAPANGSVSLLKSTSPSSMPGSRREVGP